jgi:hypothetical protein
MQLHDNVIFLLGDAEARRRAVAVGYGAEEVAEFRHHEGEPDTALGLGSISSRRCSNKPLVPQVRAVLGVPSRVAWGMTGIGLVTRTGTDPGDPPDRATESDGRPHTFAELKLRPDGEITKDQPARLFASGAGCAWPPLAATPARRPSPPTTRTAGTTPATWPYPTAGRDATKGL